MMSVSQGYSNDLRNNILPRFSTREMNTLK